MPALKPLPDGLSDQVLSLAHTLPAYGRNVAYVSSAVPGKGGSEEDGHELARSFPEARMMTSAALLATVNVLNERGHYLFVEKDSVDFALDLPSDEQNIITYTFRNLPRGSRGRDWNTDFLTIMARSIGFKHLQLLAGRQMPSSSDPFPLVKVSMDWNSDGRLEELLLLGDHKDRSYGARWIGKAEGPMALEAMMLNRTGRRSRTDGFSPNEDGTFTAGALLDHWNALRVGTSWETDGAFTLSEKSVSDAGQSGRLFAPRD